MKRIFLLTVLITLASKPFADETDLPRLQKSGSSMQLQVAGQPYLVLGGELGNSSASSAAYMAEHWPRLRAANLNTVLAPVYWELIEPDEGRFDFSSVRQLLVDARAHDLKLVILWFGAWKNSMSTYVPAWVKTDQHRFPRSRDQLGISQDILTPFNATTLAADMNAFRSLLQFLAENDATEHTVLMVQIENEIGMLPSARDHHPAANEQYVAPVPQDLFRYLDEHRDSLAPTLREAMDAAGNRTTGNWETVFGEGVATEEIFMAWHYARFANALAEAGKDAYDLPMYVNAALNRPDREPGKGYPSAGPLPHLVDIWKAAAPAIDFLAPDFYTPRFTHWSDLYSRADNPLFIPEHRFDDTAAAKSLYAIGHYAALGFAPFSIETGTAKDLDALARTYSLIEQLATMISQFQGQQRVDAVLLDKTDSETIVELGGFRFTARHDYTLGWSADAGNEVWPTTSALLIHNDDNEFYVAGNGVVMTVEDLAQPAQRVGLLSAEEGTFEDGTWVPGRRLNGDQTHQGRHIRLPVDSYAIQHFRLYRYR